MEKPSYHPHLETTSVYRLPVAYMLDLCPFFPLSSGHRQTDRGVRLDSHTKFSAYLFLVPVYA